MTASYKKFVLNFKRPSGTSRGVMNVKETWFIKIEELGKVGFGECGILRGLSIDDRPDYEETLKWVCDNIHLGEETLYERLTDFPSIQFGVEMAFRSFRAQNPFELFPSAFTQGKEGIAINGLIWMGEPDFMQEQISDKLTAGFDCIKMKIGAIDFDAEIELLQGIRDRFPEEEITLRVDANGVFGYAKKKELLQKIKPQYIILKPSLVGGFRGCDTWIQLAEEQGIGWWITSALESNIGLNAIAQYTYSKQTTIPQGLGTGALYTNNVSSPLEIKHGELWYVPENRWSFQF